MFAIAGPLPESQICLDTASGSKSTDSGHQSPLQPTHSPLGAESAEFDPYTEYALASEGSETTTVTFPSTDDCKNPILTGETEIAASPRLGPSRRFNFSILIPALATSLLSGGVASALLGWLLSRRVVSAGNDAFRNALVADEGRTTNSSNGVLAQVFGSGSGSSDDDVGTTMYGLALSSLATHLISLTVPFLMSGFAYLLASIWIQTQRRGRVGSLPTPTQYGHLVSLCSSISLGSVYDTAKYLSHRRRRPAASTTLLAAFFTTLITLVMVYTLSLSDLWLHTTANTFSYEFTTPIAPSLLPSAGSTVNKTLCSGPSPFLLNGDTYSNCQHFQKSIAGPDMYWGDAALVSEGAAVLGNTSVLSQVQMIGNLATLLPKTLPSGVRNVMFNTFAMEASCAPVTDCQYFVSDPNSMINTTYFLLCPSFTPPFAIQETQGAISMLNQFNATTNVLIFETGTSDFPASSVGPQGDSRVAGYALNSGLNPAGVLAALFYEEGQVDFAVPADQPGWYGVGDAPIFFSFYISRCVLDVWDVTVSYSAPSDGGAPSFTIASPAARSDFNTTSALLGALDSAYSGILATQLTTTLRGSLNVTAETFSAILAGNTTQGILAYAAPLTERTTSIAGEAVHSATVSRYPLAPLGMVLTLTYGYALLVLGVGVVGFCLPSRVLINPSVRDSDDEKPRTIRELGLVHLRLTSAWASIADRFDEERSSAILTSDSTSTLTEGGREERLGAGFVGAPAVQLSGQSQRWNKRKFRVDLVENLEDE
ncbi:hypothetical protein MSAN_02056600 [Mycena sanguinolenta]|uniref:Uncharacterized protein n=1 Tax=Mycena sanguinolenta TaxID=230812 RepID=A0A8H6XHG7_9AGAR|nr:hypothetical protein MSAN_02056600 [Mycena sanguinolenta]